MTNTEATDTSTTAAVAAPGAHVAPEKAASKKTASRAKGAPKAKQGAKKAKSASRPVATKKAVGKKTAKKPITEAREGSKKAIVLALLRRPKGATMAEIAKATDWQNHSIRGFISGTLTKKMSLTVESTKTEAGERTYRIAK